MAPSAPQRIWWTNLSHMFVSVAAEGSEGVNTSHSACGSHSRQAGIAKADLWPLRKGMWKLFHPGQKLKTPGQLESGSSILLSTFLIRGSKQRFSECAAECLSKRHLPFWNEVRAAAVCLLLCDHCRDDEVWLVVGNGCSCAAYEALFALTYNPLPVECVCRSTQILQVTIPQCENNRVQVKVESCTIASKY